MSWRGLTDEQWEKLRVHLPRYKPSPKGGRPRADDRRCFEGILWVLWTGAQWSELPKEYGSPSTCWRRLRQWEGSGVLLEMRRAFLAQLNDQDKIRWDECFADGSFAPAKKGGTKWMVLVDGSGTPLGAYLDSASPSEVKLLGHTLRAVAVRRTNRAGRPRKRPKRLITDRGYDSNVLRKVLKRCGIEPIIPARVNNKRATDQDGRKMRQYKRRWIVERTFAWLGQFRRLIVRHERLI